MKKDKKIKGQEEKVRRFPKFYVLDAVIIILIIAAILGIYFRYSVYDMFGSSQAQTEAQVSFSIKNIKDTTRNFISIDDKVYFKADQSDFGTLMPSEENSNEALSHKPATTTFFEDGKVITVSEPSGSRIDAEGKISCKGYFSDDGTFMLNGSNYISAGQTVTVCTELVTLEITILSIEKISN